MITKKKEIIRSISWSMVLLTSALLYACGGSSSQDTPANGPNLGVNQDNLDKYAISSYTAKVEDNGSLLGTWLFVGKINMDYRDDPAHDENESRHYEAQFRSIIRITPSQQSSDGEYQYYSTFIAGPLRVMAPYHTSQNEREFALLIDREIFIGTIENNTRITGSFIPNEYEMQGTDFVEINSSSGGLIKLSHEYMPSDNAPSFGMVNYQADLSAEQGKNNINIDQPIFAATEEHFTWQTLEDGNVTGTDEVYRILSFTLGHNSTESNIETNTFFVSNFIQSTASRDSITEGNGWKVDIDYDPGENSQLELYRRVGIEENLIPISNSSGSFATYESTGDELNPGVRELSITLNLE